MQKICTLLLFLCIAAISTSAQVIYFKGQLKGSEQVPPVVTPGFGVVLVEYNLATNLFNLVGDYQNLTSVITAAHVHNAVLGVNGSVLFNLNFTAPAFIAGGLIVSTTLTDMQEAELLAGRLYVNVHTVNYPDGEIRTQLTQTTAGQTVQVSGIFSGAAEVPANPSAGTGAVTALLDKGTSMLYLTGAFTNLGSPSTMAHLHRGAAGTNGVVAYNLNFTPGLPAGVLSLSQLLTGDDIAQIEAGLFYANVHSVNFPNGEIRAQLVLGNVLPVKLVSFNGFRSGNDVQLTWTVDNQENFKDFSIEQMKPSGNEWMHKGTVAGNNLAGNQTYQFTDIPLTGSDVLLYRLKMTDIDGKKTYSSIVKINIKNGKAQLALLSNPVTGNSLRFQLTGVEQPQTALAAVLDMNGRQLLKSGNLQAGINDLNISSLTSGVYKLVIFMGSEKMETTFLK